MKNKSKKRKNTTKKRKAQQIKRKRILLICLVMIFVVLLMCLICYTLKSKSFTCSRNNPYDKGVNQLNEISFNYSRKKLDSVVINKKITIDDKSNANKLSYLKIIDESLKSSYEMKKIEYSSKIENDALLIKLSYKDKKRYILDDVDIVLEGASVSVNVVTEDNNNNRINVDLEEKNNKNRVKEDLENKGYVCK